MCPLPYEDGDDGQELVLEASGRANGRGRVTLRSAQLEPDALESFTTFSGTASALPEQHLVEVRLVPTDADEDAQSAAQFLGGRQGRVGPQGVHPVADPFPSLGRDGGQQAVLACEVPVRRSPRHACPRAYLAQGDRFGAAEVEELGGRVEQGAAGGGGGLRTGGHDVPHTVDVVI